MKWCFVALASVVSATFALALAEPELPAPDEGPPLEIEPPLLIESRSADGNFVLRGTGPLSDPEVELAKLEKDLARAKRNAAGAEGLYRSGIIAKVEAEERALKVIRVESKLAEARLQEAKRLAQNVPKTEAVVAAEISAERAAEQRSRAELEAALRNLARQQKLLALGSGRKADVHRAEEKLAQLQHPPN